VTNNSIAGFQMRTTLRVPEIAVRLGVCEPKVYQMLADGTIPHVRHGRKYIVSRVAFERWEQSLGERGTIVSVCQSTNAN
jgi:excisionase family DNA binding protein